MSFTLYRSSAGSGKTYTLVKEYLKIILQDPKKFKHILAVTFTNKAAGEMKERIMRSLKKLAKNEDPDLETIIKNELPDLRHIDKISSKILTTLLHNYSDFAIMTIDSFIHKVIKAFALEIGLPLNFGIDLNYEKIEAYVSDKLLAAVGKDDFITEIIMAFVFARINEEKSWNIENDIRKFEKELFSEKNLEWVNTISDFNPDTFRAFMTQLNTIREDYVIRFNQLGRHAMDLIKAANLSIDDFAYKDKGAVGFLDKCMRLRKGGEKKLEPGNRFINGQWYGKSTGDDIKAAIDTLLANGLETTCDQILQHYQTNRGQALTAEAIQSNIYLAAIINRLKTLIDEYKIKNNVIPISEFNVKVYEIVKNSPIPFIYSILGEKYNHYLIDEFQDTSRMQWENLFPLIDNALGSDYFNMAVGDGKQSIYRWRGGDVEIMETDIQNRILPAQLKIKPLDFNYRSSRDVVRFNNHFFEAVSKYYKESNLLLDQIYHGIRQKPHSESGGFVSLQFIDDADNEVDPDDLVFANVHEIINRHIAEGGSPGDIAILVRENKKGRIVAEKLLENNIQVVSPDSLILSKIPVIRFLVDILTYLGNPKDKIKGASLIYYLGLNNKDTPLAPETIGASIAGDKQWKLTPELREFYNRKKYLIRMPVYEIIEEVIRIFQLHQQLDFDTRGYLQAFLDIVSNYTAENSVDASSFLEWWEFNKDEFSVIVPETKPAVKIMSIHKAKGLEFSVVIIPYADWEHKMDPRLWLRSDPLLSQDQELNIPMPVNSNKSLADTFFRDQYMEESEKVLIDNINLLYVAFTRAVDELHIICNHKKNNENYERLNQSAVPFMKEDTEHGGRYTFGERGVPKKKEKKEEEKIEYQQADSFISSKWYSRISIRRKSTEFWRFDSSYRTKRRNWGILVHDVMARIRSEVDIPRVVNLLSASGDIEKAERSVLERKIRDIFKIEQVSDWFRPGLKVYTEMPMLTPMGVLKPDRVVVDGDRVIVIDFKTGRKSPAHAEQIIQYREALQAMGYQNTEAYLFYLGTLQIEHVK